MTRRFVLGALLVAGVSSMSVFARQQGAAPQPAVRVVEVEKLRDNLYVMKGGGGNSAVFIGTDGVTVVDTDAIAHALTRPGGAAIARIRDAFGDEAIAADGAMDRKRIRELVFRDAAAKSRLEGILHPMIREESEQQVREAKGPYAMLVVPLLVESGNYRERVDRVLVVPLYPQYAAATTATVGDKTFEALAKMRWQPALRLAPPVEASLVFRRQR